MSSRCTWAAILAFAAIGCAGRTPPSENHRSLRAPGQIEANFFLRQQILARHRGRSVVFQAALEKHDNVLRLLGLTPFGSPAFMIEQSGTDVRLNQYVDVEVPIDPTNMLVDVHRVLFEGSGLRARLNDGTHILQGKSGPIVEIWANGSIVSRRFMNADSSTELSRIEFHGARDPNLITSPLVILRDTSRAYEIEIKTVEQRLLYSAPP